MAKGRGSASESAAPGERAQMEPPVRLRCNRAHVFARCPDARAHHDGGRFCFQTLRLLLLCSVSGLTGKYIEMSTSGQSYDARVYTICAPWHGRRGDAFVRVFSPEFLNGMDGQTDKYSSLRAHIEGRDPGGNAVGAPAHAGNAAQIRESAFAYGNRATSAKALIVKHITAPAVKQAIETACAAVLAGVAPLPYGAAAGTSVGQMAWLAACHFGNLPTSGLTSQSRDDRWTGLTLKAVGYTAESMIGLKALIDQTNQERPGPVRKTPEECRIKFLSLIEGHTALVNKAISEMQQSTYLVGGVADYDSTVDGFDEL